MSKQWDFKFHTSDRNFSGMGVVEAPTKAEAVTEVRKTIIEARPDVAIKSLTIRPSIGVSNMEKIMKDGGLSPEVPKS